MQPQTDTTQAKIKAYEAVASYTNCLMAERESKTRLAIALAAKRGELMKQLRAVEDELNPTLERIGLIERELNRFEGVA